MSNREALSPGAGASSWHVERAREVTNGENLVNGRAWPHKLVHTLVPFWARCSVIAFWVLLAIGGLLSVKSFMKKLESNVPPAPGTQSQVATDAYAKYFPAMPLQAAFLVKSRQHTKLVDFVNRSTCNVSASYKKDGETFLLTLKCLNSSALGSGCLRNDDIEPQLENVAMDISNYLLSNVTTPEQLKSLQQQIVAEMRQFAPLLLTKLPFDTTMCPVSTPLTADWLNYTGSLAGKLEALYPGQYVIKEQSISSIPDINQTRSIQLPAGVVQKLRGLINVTNVTLDLPAGELWQLLESQFLAKDADTGTPYATSLAALTIANRDASTAIPPAGPAAQKIGLDLDQISNTAPESLSSQGSSLGLMLHYIQEGINKVMDVSAATVPIALLILTCMIRSAKLLLIVLPLLGVVILAAILVMYPYASVITCSTTVPALMIAVDLAMTIDYSLFLSTRFQKEVQSGRGVVDAVAFMVGTSGRIVLVSGLTLLLCFLMMLSLPVAFVSSIGVAAAITVFMAVTASLTLTPALILSCPTFFSTSWPCGTSWWDRFFSCQKSSPIVGEAVQTGPDAGTQEEDVTARQAAEEEAENKRSCWPRFGIKVQKGAWVVAVALLAVVIPVALTSLPRLTQSVGLLPLMPTDAPTTSTLLDLTKTFGAGSVFPTSLVVVPPPGETATVDKRAAWLTKSCQELQNVANQVNAELEGLDGVPPFTGKAFNGVMILQGKCVAEGEGLSIGTWSDVDHPYSATNVMILYQIDPFSLSGKTWLKALRKALEKPSATAVASWYVFGVGPTQIDASELTFSRLPLMFGLMMLVVFVVIAVAMKSVIAPLRAVFCLLWMLAITYGLAVFVYQDGAFDFLGWSQLGKRASGSMSWLSPAVASAVMVGLGLDYDIFYSERVVEEWKNGYTEKEAAARALGATANIISAAGVIMVVAFLGLLLGATPVLNEIAFLLIVGVIIDCFITTKVIIPCVMALLGNLNFWPRKQPNWQVVEPQPQQVSLPPSA